MKEDSKITLTEDGYWEYEGLLFINKEDAEDFRDGSALIEVDPIWRDDSSLT